MSTQQLPIKLHKFIQHSYVLSRVSRKYNRLNFLSSLEKMLVIDQWLVEHNFKVNMVVLCKKIILHKENLYKILPATYNASYKSSLKKLTEMISEAEQGMDPVNQFLQTNNLQNGISRAQR